MSNIFVFCQIVCYTTLMENIKEIISKNIYLLRKEKKLTQLEFAERINYSDKAISRWEKGESLPDIETLANISKVFEIPISFFFQENAKEDIPAPDKKETAKKIVVTILSCSIVWMVAIIIFLYLSTYNNAHYWQVFVYAVPFTMIVIRWFNKIWGDKKYNVYINSLFFWSLITSVYCMFIKLNIWLVFIIGGPIQMVLIIYSFIKPMKRHRKK